MMLTKHEETKFMEKAERNIPRIDVFAGGLFLRFTSYLSLSFLELSMEPGTRQVINECFSKNDQVYSGPQVITYRLY